MNPAGPPKPTDEQRCQAMPNGKRCGAYAMTGLTVCRKHGGATKLAKAKSEKAKTVRAMERFATPLSPDSPLNDPIAGFEWEYRRTVGRIIWYDEELAKLRKEELTWGKTKVEEIGASEFDGTNTTFETRANTLHEMQFRERQHLLNMQKIYIGAKLDEKKLAIQREYVVALDKVISQTLAALGHDVSDPAVRQVVRENLLRLPVRGELESGK